MTTENTSPELIEAFQGYSDARITFLEKLGCSGSNRDPLAEFSERLVAVLIDGRLAESRVQKGYDVIGQNGEKIQVKYLANPEGKWINEHDIRFSAELNCYALVFFEKLQLTAVLLFSKVGLAEVCRNLEKRHPGQDISLQLTQCNYRQILSNIELFNAHGVHVLYSAGDNT